MPRCCETVPGEFAPSYASVALLGTDSLEARVAEAEAKPVTPCITAWCTRCTRASLITTDLALFQTPSAHHAHRLALLVRIAAYVT